MNTTPSCRLPASYAPVCTAHRTRLRTALRLALFAAASLFASQASAATLYLLTADGQLAVVDTNRPSSIKRQTAITGVNPGDTLVAIDVRPQNQALYALGVNSTADTVQLYHLSARTAVATPVGVAGSFVDAGNNLVALNTFSTGWDIDFDPAFDRLRVVNADGQNFRVNPNTGACIDGNLGNAGANIGGINMDAAIKAGTTQVNAAAYTGNQPNNGLATTLYTLDGQTNSLYIQNSPNSGTQILVDQILLGGNTLDFDARASFDILPGVNSASANSAVTNGAGFMVANVAGRTDLYRVNLVNGQATLGGAIGSGVTSFISSALRPDLSPAIALTADGASLVRFAIGTPGTTIKVDFNPASLGDETLVGIDFRPQTGQLYGLGINASTNSGTLYLIDPQTAALTPIGTPGQITFVDANSAAVDFPDPAITGYGFDFNPTVDRIRVVTGSGLNFRINPTTGAPVDGVSGGPINPDGAVNGLPNGSTGVSGAAYANSFGQSLSGGVTTQYTLDATSNQLFIQNPPNNGTQASPLPVTLGGNPLDFTELGGFDIPDAVAVTTSGSPAQGDGYFVGTVGGTTSLYRLNLATGTAISLGAVGAGTTAFAGLAVAVAPPVIALENPTGTPVTTGASTLALGTVSIGKTGSASITIRNTGTQALVYSSSLDVGTGFAVGSGGSGTVASGASATLTVNFTPTASGALSDTITISSNDPTQPSFTVLLAGTGAVPQTDDDVVSGNGPTRFQPLANDPITGTLTITSVSNNAITISGRTLIIPSGFTGTFTYTVSNGTILGQASVTVEAGFAATAPTKFNGILTDPSGKVAGWASASVSARGIGSAKVVFRNAAGAVVAASATLRFQAGTDAISVTTRAGAFTVDRKPGGAAGAVSVGFTPGGGTALAGLLHAHTEADDVTYTLELASIDPAILGGGYCIMTVRASGSVRLRGILPDGNPFSAGTNATDVDTVPFFTALRTGLKPPGVLGGELTLNINSANDLTGELTWTKPAQVNGGKGTQLGGVDTTLTALGSGYDRLQPLPAGSGTLKLSGGNLAAAESTTVTVTGGIPAVPTGALVTWRGPGRNGTSATGLFSVTVTVPGVTRPVRGSGVYLQKSKRAWGYFPGTTLGGRIELSVP